MAPADHDEGRLGRIERRIDQIAEALTTIARVEERTTTLFTEQSRIFDAQAQLAARLAALEAAAGSAPDPTLADRLAAIEVATATQGRSVKFGERLFWGIATAAGMVASGVATAWITKGGN